MLGLNLGLLQLGLHLLQLCLKLAHLLGRAQELVQTHLGPLALATDLRLLELDELGKHAEQLQVAGGGHIVISGELLFELKRLLCHRLVDINTHIDQTTNGFCAINLCDVLEEVVSHRPESLIRPLREPVYGAAVHQTGELSKASTKHLSNGAHTQHHVDIAADTFGVG